VHKEDRGTYYCLADNGVKQSDRRVINLEIEFAPVVTVPRKVIGQALNYDVDIECHVEAYPAPQVVWTKDSYIISNNRHYKKTDFNTADEFTDSTLRVITIEEKQYGDYMCEARNKLGGDSGVVTVEQTKNPVCPPACGHLSSLANCHKNTPFLLSIFIILALVWNLR
jgi:hypothetical protein